LGVECGGANSTNEIAMQVKVRQRQERHEVLGVECGSAGGTNVADAPQVQAQPDESAVRWGGKRGCADRDGEIAAPVKVLQRL
jgi:hypothetical protein